MKESLKLLAIALLVSVACAEDNKSDMKMDDKSAMEKDGDKQDAKNAESKPEMMNDKADAKSEKAKDSDKEIKSESKSEMAKDEAHHAHAAHHAEPVVHIDRKHANELTMRLSKDQAPFKGPMTTIPVPSCCEDKAKMADHKMGHKKAHSGHAHGAHHKKAEAMPEAGKEHKDAAVHAGPMEKAVETAVETMDAKTDTPK